MTLGTNKALEGDMQRLVTGFRKGFSNHGNPYVLAVLECEHLVDVEHNVADPWGRQHDESTYATQVGDSVRCSRCATFKRQLELLQSIDPATLSHSRFRPCDSRGSADGTYYVYVVDKSSPTGVYLALGIDATPVSAAALDALRLAALSPTERR